MTETGTDDGFWRGLCFSERFDPPSCRPLLAAGERCRSSQGIGRDQKVVRRATVGAPRPALH
ncbi:MAG: hypothetical protein WA705_23170 [Candidatus Ozemobacteraceae bacterium]